MPTDVSSFTCQCMAAEFPAVYSPLANHGVNLNNDRAFFDVVVNIPWVGWVMMTPSTHN